jgi:protein-serine/threonine kinase
MFKQTLEIPENVMSKEAEDLIRSFLTDAKNRIGYNSVEEIKKHKFFKGIDWDEIR